MVKLLHNQLIPPKRNYSNGEELVAQVETLKQMKLLDPEHMSGDCIVVNEYPIRIIQYINNNNLPLRIIHREMKDGKWHVWRLQ